jgi:hypothetical protein
MPYCQDGSRVSVAQTITTDQRRQFQLQLFQTVRKTRRSSPHKDDTVPSSFQWTRAAATELELKKPVFMWKRLSKCNASQINMMPRVLSRHPTDTSERGSSHSHSNLKFPVTKLPIFSSHYDRWISFSNMRYMRMTVCRKYRNFITSNHPYHQKLNV